MNIKKIEFFEIFPWDKNFETGIFQIDEEHKRLVNILNLLAAHLANRSHELMLNKYFDELIEYTDYHFKSEEDIWIKYFSDEWLTEHKIEHESFINQVIAFKNEEKNKIALDDIIHDIVTFLSKWLAYHILDRDKRMAKAIYYIKSGLTPAESQKIVNQEMSGSMKILIDTVLTMYERLAVHSMDIMREKILRKEAENQLIILNNELIHKSDQLKQANLMLEASINKEKEIYKLKDEFTSNVNHELRTPLTSIILTTEYLLESAKDMNQNEISTNLKKINRSSNHLLNLINELLDFSKIENGKIDCNINQINLKNIILECISNFDPICKSKNNILITELEDIIFEMDKNHIEKIISNLLSNACKFTDHGTVVIKAIESDNNIIITVSDTGIGIDNEDQNKIFDRFSQGKLKQNKPSGTGIGLHIVKNLMQRHGGKVEVKNNSDKGTTFTLILPKISKWNNL